MPWSSQKSFSCLQIQRAVAEYSELRRNLVSIVFLLLQSQLCKHALDLGDGCRLLCLEALEVAARRLKRYRFLFLEHIHVPLDVQVLAVGLNLGHGRRVCELVHAHAVHVSVDNPMDVRVFQRILFLPGLNTITDLK